MVITGERWKLYLHLLDLQVVQDIANQEDERVPMGLEVFGKRAK